MRNNVRQRCFGSSERLKWILLDIATPAVLEPGLIWIVFLGVTAPLARIGLCWRYGTTILDLVIARHVFQDTFGCPSLPRLSKLWVSVLWYRLSLEPSFEDERHIILV